MTERRVKWTCPHCNNLHYYYWDEYDIFEGECNMICNSCRNQSKQMMYIDSISGNAWCEPIKETYTTDFTLEELKKQVEVIQKRIEEIEEEKLKEKVNSHKSLHNIIAKWEFYYSERIEARRNAAPKYGAISYRDILDEEIEKLLENIEKWIDDVTKFDKLTYEPEYFTGWDQCRKTIKDKLRGPYDWYELSKKNDSYE